jgi:sugar phosphate permease
MSLFCLVSVPALMVLWPSIPPAAIDGDQAGGHVTATALVVMFTCLGATTFAPHVLTSLTARELSDADVASTSMGVVKAVGQLGGALAGSPLAAVVTVYGWHAVGVCLTVCCGISAAAYALLWTDAAAKVVAADDRR